MRRHTGSFLSEAFLSLSISFVCDYVLQKLDRRLILKSSRTTARRSSFARRTISGIRTTWRTTTKRCLASSDTRSTILVRCVAATSWQYARKDKAAMLFPFENNNVLSTDLVRCDTVNVAYGHEGVLDFLRVDQLTICHARQREPCEMFLLEKSHTEVPLHVALVL